MPNEKLNEPIKKSEWLAMTPNRKARILMNDNYFKKVMRSNIYVPLEVLLNDIVMRVIGNNKDGIPNDVSIINKSGIGDDKNIRSLLGTITKYAAFTERRRYAQIEKAAVVFTVQDESYVNRNNGLHTHDKLGHEDDYQKMKEDWVFKEMSDKQKIVIDQVEKAGGVKAWSKKHKRGVGVYYRTQDTVVKLGKKFDLAQKPKIIGNPGPKNDM